VRILSIRGENLASLYGTFQLPLDESPIAETGLFSICGPTGSGKSTLMDALCLALYGRTPRLGERGRSVMIGRDGEDVALQVEANDVRNILSRGTGEGHAEVDFEGVDGRRYRARWSVNRAHGRASGKLQGAKMTLHALPSGDVVTSGITDMPARVKDLVGYSFEDFKRAVVLPQFEFTAFLKAKSDERAVILERITGTEIYARLSAGAFKRAREEQEKVDALRRELDAVKLLTPEERQLHQATFTSSAQTQTRAKAETKAAEGDVRWYEAVTKLGDAVRVATEEYAGANASLCVLAPTRTELAEVERAQALRPERDGAARTAIEREASGKELESSRTRLAEREEAAGRLAREAEEALAALSAAEFRFAEARPTLDEARRLDAAQVDARRRAVEAKSAQDVATADARQAEDAVDEAERTVAKAQAARSAACAWLQEHATLASLAAEWPRWKATLLDHASVVSELARKEALLAAARSSVESARVRGAALQDEVAKQKRSHARLERSASEAATAAAGDDASALARTATAFADRLKALGVLAGFAEKAADAAAARKEAEEESKAHETEHAKAEREADSVAKRINAAQGKLEGAREALQRITDALDLEGRRETLVEGHACPLCGATEHPYARQAPTESAHRKQQAAVRDLESDLKELQTTAKAAAAAVARHTTGAEKAKKSLDQAAKALDAAQARYAKQRERADLARVPARAETAAAKLADLVAATEAESDAAREAQEAAVARQTRAAETRKAFEEARTALEAAEKKHDAAERERANAGKDVEKHDEQVRGLSTRRDGAESDVEPALTFRTGWRAAARAQAEAFARECESLVDSYRARETARATADTELTRSVPVVAELKARFEERAGKSQAEAVRAATEAGRLTELKQARSAVLGGRPAADVEWELSTQAKAAATRHDEVGRRRSDADLRLEGERTQVKGAQVALDKAETAAREAAAAFAAALAQRGLDAARAEALLARDEAWIAGTRKAIGNAEQAVHTAQALATESEQRHASHVAQGKPTRSLEEARAQATASEAAVSEAASAQASARERLRIDDEERDRSGQLLEKQRAQEAASVRWARLNEVIGSADGKRFRVFAQGLALDALLLHASHHLRWLAPRYALQRVPGEDLELQVLDRDLGDEVRSLNGLSGGETFLVSLGLALGLASLSTRVTQARTLFIDEGFGTLDRDTLENAMVALEGLRATGRTIGVISHVPELHERLGVRVTVERISAGRSRVLLPEGAPAFHSDELDERAAS
jgi:DNA repair protein SbcC/Rad50